MKTLVLSSLLLAVLLPLAAGCGDDKNKPASDPTSVKVLSTPADADGGTSLASPPPSGGW
jgi:hypothetical protein